MLPCTELNCRSGNTKFNSVRHDCQKLLKVEKIVDRHYSEILDFAFFDANFVHRIKNAK